MKTLTKLSILFLFLFLMLGKETVLASDPSRRYIDQDSIMNNAPIVFEGQMIKKAFGKRGNNSYLFEIEKVYRGGERLQAGTVELIVKFPENSIGANTSFGYGWHIILAKEIDMPGIIEANNSIKLELFYDDHSNFAYFAEFKDVCSGFSINFKTKEDTRDFFSKYKMYPTDIPKADTLKAISDWDKEIAREKAAKIAEETLKRAEENKIIYRQLLEKNNYLDSLLGKKTNRKAIEKAMKEYENASESERQILLKNKRLEREQKINTILDANLEKKKSNTKADYDATLITSIKNSAVTEDAAGKYLEFDVMVRADMEHTYPCAIYLSLLYESDSLGKPFKKHIYAQTPTEAWVTPGSLFAGTEFEVSNSTTRDTAINILFDYGFDGLSSFPIPVKDTLYAHVKMKINGAYSGTVLITPSVSLAFYNTTPITNIMAADRYAVSIQDTLISIMPPTPIITNYYINNLGNTIGCAGCGDILVIQGNYFGYKDIMNPDDTVSTLAFKLGDFKTTQHSTIPYYKLKENHDYILWSDTLIKIKLPAHAYTVDESFIQTYGKIYNDQYPGTGTFKVITANGKETTSAGNINIKYAVYNFNDLNAFGRIDKHPMLIPKKDCVNGFKFQVDSAISKDNAAIVCIKKAMRDWSTALGIELVLELDTAGKPVVNKTKAWSRDSINTISYTRLDVDGKTPLSAMATSGIDIIRRCQTVAYFPELDIGICDTVNWLKDTIATPDSIQFSFYTTILHELGHVLGLKHVAIAGELMQTVLSSGERVQLNSGSQYAKKGAEYIIDLSRKPALNWTGFSCINDNLEVLNSTGGACDIIIFPPAVPLNIRYTKISSTEIKVEWDSVAGAAGYVLEYSTDPSFSTIIGTYPLSGTSQNITGLTSGVTYYFRVKAYNSAGSSGYATTSGNTDCFPVGNGSSGNPYLITTANQLDCIYAYTNGSTAVYFKIGNGVNIERLSGNFTLQSKAVLTVSGIFKMQAGSQIFVQNGAKLIVSGGTVKNANITVKTGSNLTLETGGILEKGVAGALTVDKGAAFSFLSGAVKN